MNFNFYDDAFAAVVIWGVYEDVITNLELTDIENASECADRGIRVHNYFL